MLKRDEIADPKSCWNKARDDERLFVILARDPAGPATIKFWMEERVRLGLNAPADPKLAEASRCAQKMELERYQ